MIQEGHARFQELFAPESNGALSYFYASNKIISNPNAMVDILKDFSDISVVEQQKLLNEIISILQHVSTNAYILNCTQEGNIIQLIIDLIPHYVQNYLIFNKLLVILDNVLRMSSTDQRLVQKSIKRLITEFHAQEGRIQGKSLFSTINILKSFLNCKINMDKDPEKMIVFHGSNGLQVTGKKQINWLFSNGMSIYFWIYIENIKFGPEASLPKLFTLYSPNNGGLQCYLIDNKLNYRTVGSKYNSPKIGSNGIFLGQIQPKKWNFIGIQHEGPKRILGRSHIKFHLNDKKSTFNLSPPSISSKEKMKIVLFDKIYCKTSSICILPYYVEADFVEGLNKNKNSIDLIKNPKGYIFEQRQGKLYQRNQLGFCPDPILHREKHMSFETMIPLFHIFKYTEQSTAYPILNELLSLFVLFLYKSPLNQIEAQKKNYPHIISELIKSLPKLNEKFNEETINTLLHIKQTITNSQLLKQYHAELLWSFVDSKISIGCRQMLLEIIKNNFTQNVSYFSNIIGLDQMLNTILNLATRTNRCCQKHFKIIQKRFDKKFEVKPEIYGQNEIALQYILKIVELEVQNQKVNTAQEIYKLCRVLSVKFSPCFTLSFIGVIKRVLSEKINQKLNNNQGKKIIQYLMGKKSHLVFLHIIQNSFFAEVKAESARILYSVFLKKSSVTQQQQISYRLSKALWKINEDNQNENKIASYQSSPKKMKDKNQNQQLPQEMSEKLPKKLSSKSNNILKINSINSEDLQLSGISQNASKNKASSIFKQVGPQAPLLSNRTKGKKSFSFNFMNEGDEPKIQNRKKPRSKTFDLNCYQASDDVDQNVNEVQVSSNQQQIMEQQKTNDNQTLQSLHTKEQEPEIAVQTNEIKIKKKVRNFGLNIDTEAINNMYNEKGQQVVITEEQQEAQIQKARKLAKICVAAMRGEKFQEQQINERPKSKPKPNRIIVPPSTTSNKVLKARQEKNHDKLKLIEEQQQPESAIKNPNPNLKFINTSIPSPNLGSKKSKSPTSVNSINDQNLVVLYNSLMQSCVSIPTYDIVIPSVLYIFFAWIPQTNLEVKFLFDLSLIIESEDKKDRIRTLVKMPELYDFLFQLTYKALLFEQMGQKRLYTQKLEEIIKKIFAFVFREEPESLDKFAFIIDWSQHKSKQYHPKSVFLASRYVFLLIMDAIEQDLFTNSQNDKLMQRNFQYLGIVVNKFCKFIPLSGQNQSEYGVSMDNFNRVIFNQSFGMLSSIAPYFTSTWVDYLICEKYYILYKKFFCTDRYRKNLKTFETAFLNNNLAGLQNFISNLLNSQSLVLNAEAQYYLKNSFIITLIQINRFLFIEKVATSKQCEEQTQIIWQTILIILFAESIKEKNQKNNSQFVMTFLKNCKTFCELEVKKSVIIISLLRFIHQSAFQAINMTASGFQQSKDIRSSQSKPIPFVEFLIESYVNQKLFEGENISNFDNFKLNFNQVWTTGQNYEPKIKSEMHLKFMDKLAQVEEQTSDYIQKLSVLIEEQSQRAASVEVLVQASNRCARRYFRKLWKNARIYGGPWTHPELKLQNDTLFNKSLFSFQRYQGNKFYRLRICKHMSKYRLRFLLKPILNSEPQIPQETPSLLHQKQQVGLSNALMYYNQNKLLIGTRLLQWLFVKQNSINANNPSIPNAIRQLDIMMNFKKVRLIKTLTVRHGQLAIINDKLTFIISYYKEPPTHLSIAEYKLNEDKKFCKTWPIQYIKQIFKRRYVNRRRAIQVTFIHGKSAMFQFYENDHEDFIKKITKLKGTKCPNLIYNGNKSLDPKKIYQTQGLLKRWSSYQISNFEYLMQLNNLAGRSYCDLTQYPVMPWLLINFDSKLIMTEQNNYRNLTLPMGALGNQNRTKGFLERYQNMGEIQQQRFHYGTHYSSPAIIYHFLVRLSPFTQGAILLQSGKFDFADRLFFSMMDSFKNATSQYSDVRELIPQMYTFPEAYLNINKLDLGVMQNQRRVHNVELPGWSRENPYLYVTKLRKAFEEMAVSKNVSKWIDLIFGYKQRGEQAVKNLNCYVHLTYQDSINFDELKNQKTVKAIQTQVLNFGQTPTQIFTKPHQQRVSPLTMQISGTICDPNVEPRIYRPSRHGGNTDGQKEQKQQFNAMKQPGQSIIHMKWFKDSRLVFIRRNGQLLFYKWHTTQSGTPNKIPFQCAIQKEKVVGRINKNSIQNMEFYDGSLKSDSFPVELFNNGHHIALGGLADGKLLIVDTDTNAIQTYTEHSHTISCIRSDLKDNFLITGDISGHVIVWRITNNHRLSFYNEMRDHHKQITSIFISYDLRCLFTSSMDGSVYGYNIITLRKMKVFYHPKLLPISNFIVSTSPLPVIVLFSNEESIIYCYSINGQLIQRVPEKTIQHFLSPALIRDTLGFEHVVYGNEHGEIIFRTLPFLDNPVKHIVAKDAAVNRVCLSKSNKFVIVGCSDGELSVITAPDNQNVAK